MTNNERETKDMNIWRFETAQFLVIVNSVPCSDPDLSWDDDGSIRKGLDLLSLVAFDVHAACVHKPTGLCGSSHRRGCIYKREADFKDNVGIRAISRLDGCNYNSYFTDLVRECITDCRELIADAARI